MNITQLDQLSPLQHKTSGNRLARWTAFAGALTVVGVVLFYQLGDFRSLGSHEVYAAVPAREMLDSGNWVVPTYGGVSRIKKPPLNYWVIAATSRVFGGVSELTARLPAAVSAILLALVVGVWASRRYGRAAGWAAALVQATSVWVIIFGRKAEVDMLMCLLTTSALFLISESSRNEKFRRAAVRWIGVYTLVALSWMCKFHYGPTMIMAPCIAWLALDGRWKTFLHLLNPVGLAILAAAVVVWPWMLLQQVPEAWSVWTTETVGRAVGVKGGQPIWYYVPHILCFTLPWTPFALAAILTSWRRAWRNDTSTQFVGRASSPTEFRLAEQLSQTKSIHGEADGLEARPTKYGLLTLLRRSVTAGAKRMTKLRQNGDAHERFLWVWFFVHMAIVTVSVNKHKHYILATMPLFSLLAGRQLIVALKHVRRGGTILDRRGAVVASTVLTIVGVVGAVAIASKWPHLMKPALTFGAFLGVGGTLTAWAAQRGRLKSAIATGAAALLGCYITATGWIVPGRDHRLTAVQFAREVRSDVADEAVLVHGLGEDPFVFYLESPAVRSESSQDVALRLKAKPRLTVVTFAIQIPHLEALGDVRVVREAIPAALAPPPKHPPLVLLELSRTVTQPRRPEQQHRPYPDRRASLGN